MGTEQCSVQGYKDSWVRFQEFFIAMAWLWTLWVEDVYYAKDMEQVKCCLQTETLCLLQDAGKARHRCASLLQ